MIWNNMPKKTDFTEQLYTFVDKTGHCFEDFQNIGDKNNGERKYNDCIGAMLRGGKEFIVGNMLAFRDDLTNAGFKWGIDFYVKRV